MIDQETVKISTSKEFTCFVF